MTFKTAKLIAWIGLAAMTLVLLFGFTYGNFFSDGGAILTNPWGIVSMVDLYVGFTLFSAWIAYRETNHTLKVLWIVGMMVFGFFTGSLYVLVNLYRSHGDWNVFFFGKNRQ